MDRSITSETKTTNYNRTCDWFKCKKLIEKGEKFHDVTLGRNTKLSVHMECFNAFHDNVINNDAENQF